MAEKIKVVHYINQFFGQYGSEDTAHMGPEVKVGAIGPGLSLQKALGERGEIVATIICGDNYIAERLDVVTLEIVELIRKYEPDLVVAGPAYGAGRYGVACGSVCAVVQKELGIPAITGMYEENPGVDIFRQDLFIIKTGTNARTMAVDTKNIVSLGMKLVTGEEIGTPDEEGYFVRGLIKNKRSDKNASKRTVDMLLAKYNGRSFQTEVPIVNHDDVIPAPPVVDLSKATIVMVTDGGLYPADNPDNMPTGNADRFGIYSVEGKSDLAEGDYTVCHRGYNTAYVLEDPDRLVPLDAMRMLEKDGYIGKLHDYYLGTTGLMTSLTNAKKIGQGMAAYIKEHHIDGVLLTST